LTPEQAERSRASLADDPLRAGGRGFTLMKSLLDGCEILPTPGGGATIVLTKRLPETAVAPNRGR
jgi:anti-sigma regulatory factor (Ser/Thr protein kinase)